MKSVACTFALLMTPVARLAWADSNFQEFVVWRSTDDQGAPGIYGSIAVWHQFVSEYGDYDVYVADVSRDVDRLVMVIGDANDQMNPAIYGNMIVWQDFIVWEDSADWDIWAAEISDPIDPYFFEVSCIAYNDEQRPAIHGNVVVWQDGAAGDFDIYGADITEPDDPTEFVVAAYDFNQQVPAIYRTMVLWQDDGFVGDDGVRDDDVFAADIWLRNSPEEFAVSVFERDQQAPAISGNTIVWQDNFFGDWDIYLADISDLYDLIELPVCSNVFSQQNPDIDGNIVVWQDDRSGNWDIYGYNIITGQEFPITDNPYDQTNPAISGNVVLWQDDRGGSWNIYAALLDGPEAANCARYPSGDVTGDCRVDLADFAVTASDWLECNLEPQTACGVRQE